MLCSTTEPSARKDSKSPAPAKASQRLATGIEVLLRASIVIQSTKKCGSSGKDFHMRTVPSSLSVDRVVTTLPSTPAPSHSIFRTRRGCQGEHIDCMHLLSFVSRMRETSAAFESCVREATYCAQGDKRSSTISRALLSPLCAIRYGLAECNRAKLTLLCISLSIAVILKRGPGHIPLWKTLL